MKKRILGAVMAAVFCFAAVGCGNNEPAATTQTTDKPSVERESVSDKKIGMMVDEWGIWTDVEPGTNPGFLYQQNTMRDALVAGNTLNIFKLSMKDHSRYQPGCYPCSF